MAEKARKSPVTGVQTVHDVFRHVTVHGPARNEAERDELLAVIDDDEHGYEHETKQKEQAR